MLALSTISIGVASFFALAAADHGHVFPRSHHHGIANRTEHRLTKRFGGRATYYETGLGACGISNSPSDKIVALNAPQYGDGYPGPHCFQGITICARGKCRKAQITDKCPGCPYGALDMSQSLFEYFADISEGVFQMTWSFGDGEPDEPEKPDPPKTTKKPDLPETTEKPDPPKTSKKPEPEPESTTASKKHTTTSKPKPETTSTPEPTTSTSSSEPSTTSTSEAENSTTSQHPTSTVETSVVPSTTTSAGSGSDPGSSGGTSGGSSESNWADLNQVMLAMGRLATAAHGA
ncbi:hypothetical protein FRC07_008744 [Ceratobasidium sp. 392]|nr:hypothetical protein FRC07_008744 [Ceratobasidium sp. 392]